MTKINGKTNRELFPCNNQGRRAKEGTRLERRRRGRAAQHHHRGDAKAVSRDAPLWQIGFLHHKLRRCVAGKSPTAAAICLPLLFPLSHHSTFFPFFFFFFSFGFSLFFFFAPTFSFYPFTFCTSSLETVLSIRKRTQTPIHLSD